MEHVNTAVKFLQDNWLTIALVVTGFIVLLKAIADFRVDWAKTTADKSDDLEAHLFRMRVNIFIKALKNVFKIKDKKGFINLNISKVGAVIGVIFVVLVAFNNCNKQPAKVERNTEIETKQKQEIAQLKAQIVELENYKKKSEESKKLISKEKHYYPSGVLKSEKDINDERNKQFEEDVRKSMQVSIEYQKVISELQEQLKFQEKIKNSQVRLDARIVYDSERGLEYEGSAAQSFYSVGAGVNPERKAWRVSTGLGYNLPN